MFTHFGRLPSLVIEVIEITRVESSGLSVKHRKLRKDGNLKREKSDF